MNGVVFCDLDGTLIDSRKDLVAAINKTRKSFGLGVLPLKIVTQYIGNGVKNLTKKSFSDAKAKNINIEEACRVMKANYSKLMFVNTKLYPSVYEGLKKIAKNKFKLVLFTNKTKKEAETILLYFGILSLFSIVIGDDGKFPLKPAPDAIFDSISKLDADISKSWIIGDNWTDVECGRNAGIKTAYAAYGFGDHRNIKYDFTADSFVLFADMICGTSQHS
jgi:HAD superfamily hydrolase (TIGR01549 family)